MTTVTVGIPSYNYGRFLEEAVVSALSADEVIVIDDASTDDSAEIVRRYPDVTLIEHVYNSGSAVAAINELIDIAQSDFLILLSADDALFDHTVDDVRRLGSKADWLWGNLDVVDEHGRLITCYDYAKFPRTVQDCQEFIRQTLSLYPTMVAAFRLSWLRENGLQAIEFENARGFADGPTGWTWLKAEPRLYYTHRPFAKYRAHLANETHTCDREAFTAEFSRMVRG